MADEKLELALIAATGVALKKLTCPSLDYIGLKMKDKIRTWMSSKTKEKAQLRQFEQAMMLRHLDLLTYGNDQYSMWLDSVLDLMLERHFEVVTPLIAHAVTNAQIPLERALNCIVAGYSQDPKNARSNSEEMILYQASAGAMDLLIAVHTAKIMLRMSNRPAEINLESPMISDEELDAIMQDPKTIQEAVKAVETSHESFLKMFERALKVVYVKQGQEQLAKPGQSQT